jgi:serine/threonine protein kinase
MWLGSAPVVQKANYLHRDISAENILLYNQREKLSDLEFSAVYDPDADSSEITTSSIASDIHFMVDRMLTVCAQGMADLYVCGALSPSIPIPATAPPCPC